MIESGLLSTRIFLAKVTPTIDHIFVIDSELETNPLMHKIKDLNGEKILGSFYEKEILLSKL